MQTRRELITYLMKINESKRNNNYKNGTIYEQQDSIETKLSQVDNNNSDDNINGSESQIDPILQQILQIESKYEYITKIQELRQYINKYLKLVYENKSELSKEDIDLLNKISIIITDVLDILKYLPFEQIKNIYENLLKLVSRVIKI